MPDKIFTILGKWKNDINEEIKNINSFLEKNIGYEVKSVTSIRHESGDSFTGIIIVVGERK